MFIIQKFQLIQCFEIFKNAFNYTTINLLLTKSN